jgi:hypothetical protein
VFVILYLFQAKYLTWGQFSWEIVVIFEKRQHELQRQKIQTD